MDLRTRLTLEGSDFGKTLNDATKQVEDFQKTTDNTSKSVNEMGKTTSRSTRELLQQIKATEGTSRSMSNYRQQLSQITREITDLTVNYRSMSDEMKNSDFGREVAAKITELTQKAGEYKDAIIDAQMSVKALSSDTGSWDAMKGGIELVSSSMQAFVATGVLGEQTTEKLVEVLAKLKAMEVATAAAIKIGNALQKESALMMGIAKVQAAALAKAKALETTATKGATIAQRAFNAVAKANPYVLLASAIIAVVSAIAAFTRAQRENNETQEAARKAYEKAKDRYDKFAEAIGGVIVKFKSLQYEWSKLNDKADKENFVKKHKKDFDDLGVSITSVGDAEKVFVTNTVQVMKAFELRAKAAAAAALAAEAYKEALSKEQEVQENRKKSFNAYDIIPNYGYEEYKTAAAQQNKLSYIDTQGNWRFLEEGAKKASEMWMNIEGVNDSYKEGDSYIKTQVDLLAEANKILEELGIKSNELNNNGNDNKDPIKFETGSVAYYDSLIAEVNKKLKNEKLTYEEIVKLQEKIKDLELLRYRAQTGKAGYEIELIPELKPKKIEDKLKDTTLTIPAEIDIDEDAIFDATNNLLGAFWTIQSSIQSIYSTWTGFMENMEEADNPFEQMMTGVSAVLSTLQSITSVLETMNKLSALFNALENASWLIEKKKTEEKMKQTGVNATNLALEEQEAVASATKAAGEAGSSASKIPMVGWIVAIGAIAAIIAAIASAKSSLHFAQGGIVPGSSFSGDKIAASLNSGEMVLNKQQQNNLFNLLDNGAPAGASKVEFIIKGQDLKGVLDNYGRKMSRI